MFDKELDVCTMYFVIKQLVNNSLRKLGYEIRRPIDVSHTKASNIPLDTDFTLYTYLKNDGTFDYRKYRQTQEEGNKRKIDNVWVIEKNIEYLAKYIKKQIGNVRFGMCHGTRRGLEQKWFRKYLGKQTNVIGTEISETATDFPNTIQWDFHKVKPEWKNKADFIYSNSLDHSYDPEKALNAWMSCVRPGGLCIIEHSDGHHESGANQLDPFGAHIVKMPYLITKWGKGKYGVREILNAPSKKKELDYISFIVIQKFK